MTAAKKANLLDLQKTYGLDEIEPAALSEIRKLVPLEFNTDKRGNLSSRYQETTVLIDNEHTGIIEPGEMWVVYLKTGTSYYYAVPRYKVDEQFIAAVLAEDHCQTFMDRIFDVKKGIKPRYEPSLKAVMDVMTREALERLAASETERKDAADRVAHLEKQLKTTVDKNTVLQKKHEDEVANLKAEVKELKKAAPSETAKEDRRQLDSARRECVSLRRQVSELEIKVKEAEGTNSSLKKSYEESLAKADEDVRTANAQRDAVAESKQRMADDYEARIKELLQAANNVTKNAVKEQVSNPNEMIDQLQVDLANEKANFNNLMHDYSELQKLCAQVEKERDELLESSKKSEKKDKVSHADQETIRALQEERKALMDRIGTLEKQASEKSQESSVEAEKRVRELEAENQILDRANDKLREEIVILNGRLESAGCEVDFSSPAKDTRSWSKPSFRVKRVSEIALESDWFTEPRYNVLRSMTGNQLLIMPDEHGYVSCRDYTLEIAGLDRIVDFTRNMTLEVVQDPDNDEILVTL